MSKLLYADMPRVFKAKAFYLILLLAAVLGSVSVIMTYMDMDDESLLFMLSSNNLVLFLSMFIALFAGGLSMLLIAAEFSGGVIRNKFIMGHRRSSILFSWTLMYAFTTLLTFIVYFGSYFITLLAFGADMSRADAGAVVTNLFLIFLFMLKFQMFSMLMICIYPDAKTAVICYILSNMSTVPSILLSVGKGNEKITRVLSRFIFGGYVNNFNLGAKTDKPWLTAICVVMLGMAYLLVANAYFKKKDLK